MELKTFTTKQFEGSGVAVFATLNVIDKDGDVTLPGAFGQQDVTILPAHAWGSVPLGKATTSEVGNEARAEMKFNESNTAQEWHAALKFDIENGNPLQEWSYGFTVIDSSLGEFEGQDVRFLKEMKVHEISPVLVGAGENTRTLVIKSASQPMAEQLAQVLAECKDIATRITEIRELRAKKGKDISGDRLKEVEMIMGFLDTMVEASEALKLAASDSSAVVFSELARFEESRNRILTLRHD